MTAFDAGVRQGMEKTALSMSTIVEAARRRGVSPDYLHKLIVDSGSARRLRGRPLGGASRIARNDMMSLGSDFRTSEQGRAYLKSKWLRGGEKIASEIPDRVIAAAITGAFLGGALADRPEDRKKYMVGGALVGGFLSHKRLQRELRQGLGHVV